jgi:predicted nuclease of predicted toxin-antitoxin system
MRFLIDENLSTTLAGAAHEAGHEAYHVVHLGMAGDKDHVVLAKALELDAIIVTNNARDFRGLVGHVDLHPGLIIVLPCVAIRRQNALFAIAVKHLEGRSDLINKVLEVDEPGSVTEYEMPA